MKAGDIILIDGKIKGKVLSTSDAEYLDYQLLAYRRVGRRYIGVSPEGNPRVKVVRRSGRGDNLPTPEWGQKENRNETS